MVFFGKPLFSPSVQKRLRKYMQTGFLDSLRIFVRGGTGGNGLPKYGGIGGQGGSVSVVAKEQLNLEHVLRSHPKKRISAKHGANSSGNFILGPPGENVQIHVPVGVTLFTDNGNKIGELNEEGEQVVVAKGGSGGHSKNGYLGTRGQARSIKLDLKLIADVGLVGFPNAGKSTLLKAVSQAKPKIANYPFTTIKPNVGILVYKDLRQISMADLPGLIEGAHSNKGMGHKFLKHIERTKLLILVIDINGFQLGPQHHFRNCLETILLLNKELELYNPDLLRKPAIAVINKMDTEGARDKYEEIKHKVRNLSDYMHEFPKALQPQKVLQFDDILAVSAKEGGENVVLIMNRLRHFLDLHAAVESEQNASLMTHMQDNLREKGPRLV